jgi:hypothetical protein
VHSLPRLSMYPKTLFLYVFPESAGLNTLHSLSKSPVAVQWMSWNYKWNEIRRRPLRYRTGWQSYALGTGPYCSQQSSEARFVVHRNASGRCAGQCFDRYFLSRVLAASLGQARYVVRRSDRRFFVWRIGALCGVPYTASCRCAGQCFS